jgi:hypothetical protein
MLLPLQEEVAGTIGNVIYNVEIFEETCCHHYRKK